MDIELIKQAQMDNQAAWHSLLQEVYPQAQRQALSLLRDHDLAEDAVQNTLIKIYTHLINLKDPIAFNAWWRRILTNETFMILRLHQRQPEQSMAELSESTSLNFALDDLVALRLELARSIRLLPLEQQQILLEADLRGKSLQAIAAEQSLPLGTVKSRLFRARERLRLELQLFKQSAKERKIMDENLDFRSTTELFYDYLDGNLASPAKAQFEQQLRQHPEWEQELSKHKDFLTLLHSLTGKLTLTAEEIIIKMRNVEANIQDYEQIVDETHFDQGIPQTLSSHIWFRSPNLYRTDAAHPSLGSFASVIRGNEVLTLIAETKQAIQVNISDELLAQTNLSVSSALKRMSANKSSRLLGTEYLHGRPALHLQFNEQAPQLGDMVTHLWMDKETWMPLVTEQYNADGQIVSRKTVRELRLNQGLSDSFFDLEIPTDYSRQRASEQPIEPLEDISFAQAAQRLGYQPWIIKANYDKVIHQWLPMSPTAGVLLSQYFLPGEPVPYLTISQGPLDHSSIPPHLPRNPVLLQFAGNVVDGIYIALNIGPIKGLLTWTYQGLYLTCGGNYSLVELLDNISKMEQ